MSSTSQDKILEELLDSAMGDGFAAQTGCRMIEWSDGYARVELDVKPEHLNKGGSVHGGVLATVIDVTSALAGLYGETKEKVRLGLTLSLNISFTGRVTEGKIIAIGKVKHAGRSIFFSRTEVFDDKGNAIAHGDAVNKYFKKPAA